MQPTTAIRKYGYVTVLFSLFIFLSMTQQAHSTILKVATLLPLTYLIIFGSNFDHRKVFVTIAQVLTIILGLVFTAIFIFNPLLADSLGREDYIIEYATAIFAFVASLMLLPVALYFKKQKQYRGLALTVLGGVGFFIVAMEEISWMQRILDIGSPSFFLENNMQSEINLHNMSTNLTMISFFVLTYMFFVIAPFFKSQLITFFKKKKLSDLEIFIPSRWLILPMLISLSFTSPVSLTRETYIAKIIFAIMIMIWYLFETPKIFIGKRILLSLSLVVFSLSFYVFMNLDTEQLGIRHWAASEYREFLVCLTILFYAIDLAFRTESDKGIA